MLVFHFKTRCFYYWGWHVVFLFIIIIAKFQHVSSEWNALESSISAAPCFQLCSCSSYWVQFHRSVCEFTCCSFLLFPHYSQLLWQAKRSVTRFSLLGWTTHYKPRYLLYLFLLFIYLYYYCFIRQSPKRDERPVSKASAPSLAVPQPQSSRSQRRVSSAKFGRKIGYVLHVDLIEAKELNIKVSVFKQAKKEWENIFLAYVILILECISFLSSYI